MLARMFTMVCDLCTVSANSSEYYSSVAKAQAKIDGWIKKRGFDICPTCSKLENLDEKMQELVR